MQSYNTLDQQIHTLSQVIAKFNRTFVPEKQDDSHTNLFFDPLSHRLYGRWTQLEKRSLILSLHLREFKFQFINEDRNVVKEISIDQKTAQELEECISNSIIELGLKSEGYRDEMHYNIPNYPFIDEPFVPWNDHDILYWEKVRELANEACHLTNGHLTSESDIRIWPHHFDTGIYVKANSKRGLGFGLAMKDSMVNDAYFYYSVYAINNQDIEFVKLPKLGKGRWIINDNWKGAVLSISDLGSSPRKQIKQFIIRVTKGLLS